MRVQHRNSRNDKTLEPYRPYTDCPFRDYIVAVVRRLENDSWPLVGENSPLRRAVTTPDFQNNCLGTRYDLLTHLPTVSFSSLLLFFSFFFFFILPSLRFSRVGFFLLFSFQRFVSFSARFFLVIIIFFFSFSFFFFFLIGEVVETDLKFNRGIGSAVMCSIALWLVTDDN